MCRNISIHILKRTSAQSSKTGEPYIMIGTALATNSQMENKNPFVRLNQQFHCGIRGIFFFPQVILHKREAITQKETGD